MKVTRFLTATALVAATAGALAVASPASAAEGSFTPTTISPGDTFNVTFSNTGSVDDGTGNYVGDDQCDDYGSDDGSNGTYSDRPMWVGFIPGDVTDTDPDDLDLYAEDIVSLNIGTLPSYTHPDESSYGWVGEFEGTGTLPELEPGTYTVALNCGFKGDDGPDGNGTPVLVVITVPGDPMIDLELELILDQSIDGGGLSVPVEGSGLKPGADYTVTLRSNPVVIGTGVVDPDGGFSASYPIPANTPNGGHSVTVDSVDPGDNPVSAVGYFNLEGGVVTGVSADTPFPPGNLPVELPPTGSSTLPMTLAATALVMAGGLMLRRRSA